MRGRWLVIVAVCAAGGSAACGSSEKRDPKDPTDERSTVHDDTPKWEGASSSPPETPASGKSSPGGTSGGSIQEATPKRTDQYDKEATEVVLRRAARQVQANCGHAKDESGKAVGPWGKATVMVQLGSNGHSKGVTVPDPYNGKPTGNCVEKAFTNLTFPPWAGADAEVAWEVDIVEPGKEGKPTKK